ncbi:hypothetical protein [Spirulina subsalsa]|uniref:hypothetical protein n=1 Tax=Spirulina subsalsa TaxID=54311 RepID=UPI000307615B|nr:hypothetical protein [Spirulina subsalsa]
MNSRFCQALLITGVVALTACGNANMVTDSNDTVEANSTATPSTETTAAEAPTPDHSVPSFGGQVVETGAYHFELVPVPEANGIHLDLYLQTGDTHEAIADAQVVAQVQLPDGTFKEIPMEYDVAGEHFFAFFPTSGTGEYKTVIQTDIQGEKVNARFSFSK